MTRAEYLREVEWQLRDVPWKRRKQLIGELAAHLDETPPDELDSPAAYATALRESAGLPRKGGLIVLLRAQRPRSLVVAALLFLVVALLAVALAWVESYQPLTAGNFGINPVGARPGPAGEEAVTYRDGQPFELGFSVENNGPFTVRVVDGPHLPDANLFSSRLFVSGPLARAHKIPGPLSRFHPFDLPPGEQRELVLRGVFSHCRDWAGNTGAEFTSLPVRYGFLWRTNTVEIKLLNPLVIQVPARRRCLAQR